MLHRLFSLVIVFMILGTIGNQNLAAESEQKQAAGGLADAMEKLKEEIKHKPVSPWEVPFEVIDYDSYSKYEGKQTAVVIRTASEWEKFWPLVKGEVFPPSLSFLPEVDFEKEMILVCLDGQRPDSSYHIEVTGIEDIAGERRIYLKTQSGGGVAADVITSPYCAIRFPKTDLPLSVYVSEHLVKNYDLPLTEAESFLREINDSARKPK